MDYYKIDLPEAPGANITFPARMGNWNLTLVLRWPTEIQEMWDEFQTAISKLGSDDPIVTQVGFQRDYNYIHYYGDIEDVEQFLASSENLPLSITNAPVDQRPQILEQRVIECKSLLQYEQELQEHLKWLVTVTDQFGNSTEAIVEPGGWYNNQTNDFSFKFYSTKDYIGYTDLQYVSLIVRTN